MGKSLNTFFCVTCFERGFCFEHRIIFKKADFVKENGEQAKLKK
jgi:hypothetical protein